MADEESPFGEVLSFKLNLHLDATITVESASGTQDWVKPGATTGMKWGYVPTEDQLAQAIVFLTHNILEPVMDNSARVILERERHIRQEMSG